MVDLVRVDSAVRRAPCTLAHRKIPLSDKPPKCYGIILDDTGALLSSLVTEVHGVPSVPHLHLLPSRVDGALLILQCHGCSPLAWLPSLIVENTSFIHENARAGKTVAYPTQPKRLPRRPIGTA